VTAPLVAPPITQGSAPTWDVRHGHVLDVLRAMEPESVQVCVTSPPYWGLRAYKTEPQVWGGNPGCEHEWTVAPEPARWKAGKKAGEFSTSSLTNPERQNGQWAERSTHSVFCTRCGAWRGELGSEPTIELYVEHIVAVFREVRRVLRPDGTLWLNVGDSMAGAGRGPTGWNGIGDAVQRQGFEGGTLTNKQGPSLGRVDGLKKKDCA